jgi:hypothetical protein
VPLAAKAAVLQACGAPDGWRLLLLLPMLLPPPQQQQQLPQQQLLSA